MQKDLFKIISDKYAEMSKSHKLIASYVTEHGDVAAFLTATKLGKNIGISESTVVRFAIELGFSGYPEFQNELQRSLRTKLTSIQRIGVADTMIGEGDVLSAVLHSDMDDIKTTLAEMDNKAFENAVETICTSKKIFIIGVRSSSMLADFLHHYLCYMFPEVRLMLSNSTDELFEQIFRMDENDCLIAISFPRYSSRTKLAAEFTRRKGAKVIAITDSEVSPIAPYADAKLFVKSNMASFVDSLVAPLSIINALIIALGRKKNDTVRENFDELEKIWEEYEVYENTGEQ